MANEANTPAVEEVAGSTPATTQVATAVRSVLKLPEIKKVTGEVTNVASLAVGPNNNQIVLMTVAQANGEQVTISASAGYFKKVGTDSGIQEGSIVSADYEERVAGRTGYAPEPGAAMIAHTGSGLNLTRLVKASKAAFERSIQDASRGNKAKEALGILAVQEVDLQGAAAVLLGQIYGR